MRAWKYARQVERELNIHHKTIQQSWTRWRDGEGCQRRPGSGRPRKTTPVTDRKLIIARKRNRFDSVLKLTVVCNLGSRVNYTKPWTNYVFQHNNAPPHRAAIVTQCLKANPNSPVAIAIIRPFSHRTCLGCSWPTRARSLSLTSCISRRSPTQTDRPVESHPPR